MDIRLSDRMKMVADMATGPVVADIGCDHGYVSIYLLGRDDISSAIAMDLREGPLKQADLHIREQGLSEYIDIRLSDGFDKLDVGEASCAVIAGMGGILMTDILRRGRRHTEEGIDLVLQPQSDYDILRDYLCSINYRITDEQMLVEDGKYYTAIRAIAAQGDDISLSKAELMYGPILIERKNPILTEFLIGKQQKLNELISEMERIYTRKAADRIKELKEELLLLEETLYTINH